MFARALLPSNRYNRGVLCHTPTPCVTRYCMARVLVVQATPLSAHASCLLWMTISCFPRTREITPQ